MAMQRDDILRVVLRERIKLVAYITAIIQDRHQAEDLFQELSVQVCQKAGTIQDVEHLMGWLRTGARLLALGVIRQRKSHRMVFSSELIESLDRIWSEVDREDSSDVLSALRKCVAQLPQNARELIEMRYLHELDGNAIAHRLSRSRNAVYIALSRIHKSLGACIHRRMAGREGGRA